MKKKFVMISVVSFFTCLSLTLNSYMAFAESKNSDDGIEVSKSDQPKNSRFQDWKLISEDDGIKTYQRDSEVKYRVGFRGEVTVDAPIQDVAALLADMESRKKWMYGIVDTHRIQYNSIFDRVEYNHTAVSWPFQDRDFVYEVKVKIDPKSRVMNIDMKSTTHKDKPPKDGVVRGEMYMSNYYVKEVVPGKKTFIAVEIEIDPMGAIPMWLVRLKQRSWPRTTLSGLRDYLAKNKVPLPAEFKPYIDQMK